MLNSLTLLRPITIRENAYIFLNRNIQLYSLIMKQAWEKEITASGIVLVA